MTLIHDIYTSRNKSRLRNSTIDFFLPTFSERRILRKVGTMQMLGTKTTMDKSIQMGPEFKSGMPWECKEILSPGFHLFSRAYIPPTTSFPPPTIPFPSLTTSFPSPTIPFPSPTISFPPPTTSFPSPTPF